MNIKKLEPQDLFKSIEYIGQRRSSADDINSLSQCPINILVYNEIMRFSKKDIEYARKKYRNDTLYSSVLESENEFLYAALLQKKAFYNSLNDGSKWLLNQASAPSLELCDCIYKIQYDKYKRKDKKHFLSCVANYLNKLDTQEKVDISIEFYNTYGKQYHKELIAICFDSIDSNLTDYLLIKLKEDKINLNEENLMQEFLPKKKYNDNSDTQFFISSVNNERMKLCLEKGFRYEEEMYDFCGKTLMTALLESERVDLVTIILPYLRILEPKDNLVNGKASNINYELLNLYKDRKEFQEIKGIFYKLIHDSYEEKFKVKKESDPLKIKI